MVIPKLITLERVQRFHVLGTPFDQTLRFRILDLLLGRTL